MRQTRDHFVILLARLEAIGVDRDALIAEADLDLEQLEASDGARFFDDARLLAAAEAISGDPLIALRAHLAWGSNYRSLFERYLRAHEDVRSVLATTARRFAEHFPDLEREVEESAAGVVLSYRFAGEQHPSSIEHYAMTAASFFIRAAGESARTTEIRLPHQARAPVSTYEELFGCRVRFSCPLTGLVFAPGVLDVRLQQASREIRVALQTLLGSQGEPDAPREGGGRFLEETARALRKMLYSGMPLTLDNLSHQTGINRRTLQRHLTDSGASFRELRSDAIGSFAKKRLAESDLSISQIAEELGFQSPTSFSRAFSASFGESPSGFRSRNRARG